MKQVPKVPAKNWIFKNAGSLLKDPLVFLTKAWKEYGDIFDSNVPIYTVAVISHPDYLKHILSTNRKNYPKSADYQILKLALGEGLLTSEGDFWRRQRRISQPAFHRDRLSGFVDTFVKETEDLMERWESDLRDTNILDINKEMMSLTLRVVAGCLFGADVGDRMEGIQEAIGYSNEFLTKRMISPTRFPIWLPFPSYQKFHKMDKRLNIILYDIIEQRAKSIDKPNDLLTMLMEARDEETGEAMSTKQLRDEVATLFVAGHETSANALSWTFYQLTQNPDKLQLLVEEVDSVLRGGVPKLEDLQKLVYTRQVLEESMRLYPPAWSVGRRALEEDQIGDYQIVEGTQVLTLNYAVHRHPDYWKNPEAFEPERFSANLKKGRDKYAYIPFGAGQRMCIGNNFAMMEMTIIVAMILSKYNLKLVENEPVEMEALITLRPKKGIFMEVGLRGQI